MLLAPFSTFKWKAQKYVCLIITVALVATFIATRTQFFPSFSSEKTVAFQLHLKCREWNENQCNCNFRANTGLWRSFTWFMCKSETKRIRMASTEIERNCWKLAANYLKWEQYKKASVPFYRDNFAGKLSWKGFAEHNARVLNLKRTLYTN